MVCPWTLIIFIFICLVGLKYFIIIYKTERATKEKNKQLCATESGRVKISAIYPSRVIRLA